MTDDVPLVRVEAAGRADSRGFEDRLRCYSGQVGLLLTENPWAFWRKGFWTYGHWARRDPELRKILARINGLLDELRRRHGAGEIADSGQERVRQVLALAPDRLTLDAALEAHDTLERVVIETGDASYICAEIERERLWAQGSTTWLTWDRMYGTSVPEAVEIHRAGRVVPAEQLDAARNQLSSFRRARGNDYQVHRARQRMRARNLNLLAALLVPLVVALALLLAAKPVGGASARDVGLVAVLGALGAVMSGTIRARDRLVRGSDLRAFRAGLLAQVLIGAASSLILFLLLASSILTIAGADSVEGRAIFGFVAGFSEPFFLKTVERVARLGAEEKKD